MTTQKRPNVCAGAWLLHAPLEATSHLRVSLVLLFTVPPVSCCSNIGRHTGGRRREAEHPEHSPSRLATSSSTIDPAGEAPPPHALSYSRRRVSDHHASHDPGRRGQRSAIRYKYPGTLYLGWGQTASTGAKDEAETPDRPLFLGPSPSSDARDAPVVMPSEPRYPRGVSASGNDACDDPKTRVAPAWTAFRRPLGEDIRKRPHPSIPHSMTTPPSPCALMPRKTEQKPSRPLIPPRKYDYPSSPETHYPPRSLVTHHTLA